MQVHFPVPLCVDVCGQVHAGEFAGEALFLVPVCVGFPNHFSVVVVGACGVAFENFEDPCGFIAC